MKRIYKYTIDMLNATIKIPEGFKILKVGMQNDDMCIWCYVETDNTEVIQKFSVHGTGHEILEPVENYIGTVFDRQYVWHLFLR